MKLPNLRALDVKLPDLPKPVMISTLVIAGSMILFLVLFLTLGSARDTAQGDVARLREALNKAQGNVKQSKEDYDFILANQQRFDSLIKSDKLIPHTRRTAIRQMQALALEFGLTSLNYNFQAVGAQAPEAVVSQPKGDDYRVYIENIELSVGSPLDQSIYAFIAALNDDFPGSMVVLNADVERASVISTEALNKVSRGEESGLVTGKIKYSWRTAQQNKIDEKKK